MPALQNFDNWMLFHLHTLKTSSWPSTSVITTNEYLLDAHKYSWWSFAGSMVTNSNNVKTHCPFYPPLRLKAGPRMVPLSLFPGLHATPSLARAVKNSRHTEQPFLSGWKCSLSLVFLLALDAFDLASQTLKRTRDDVIDLIRGKLANFTLWNCWYEEKSFFGMN